MIARSVAGATERHTRSAECMYCSCCSRVSRRRGLTLLCLTIVSPLNLCGVALGRRMEGARLLVHVEVLPPDGLLLGRPEAVEGPALVDAPLGSPADEVSSVVGDRAGVRAWCVMLLLGAPLVSPSDEVSSVAEDRTGEHPKC